MQFTACRRQVCCFSPRQDRSVYVCGVSVVEGLFNTKAPEGHRGFNVKNKSPFEENLSVLLS